MRNEFTAWLIAVALVPCAWLCSECKPIGCDHDFVIYGDLSIPYEKDRALTVRLCHNDTCATADDVRDGDPIDPPQFAAMFAEATFKNTAEVRSVEFSFWGSEYERDDDYSVDVWLADGRHILQLVFKHVDRGSSPDDKCDGETYHF